LSMKISLRALRGIKLLPGSPILRSGGPRYASTATPRYRLAAQAPSYPAQADAEEVIRSFGMAGPIKGPRR
jgi:hypothetical protein